MATLNNCRYTSSVVLVRLSELLSRHGYPPLTEPLSAAKLQLAALERRITETYLEHKSDPLVGTIEPSMYIGKYLTVILSITHSILRFSQLKTKMNVLELSVLM